MQTLKIHGKSFVLKDWLSNNLSVHVHLDRLGSSVVRSEVTFFMRDNPFDGGPCPAAMPGSDWDIDKAGRWLTGGGAAFHANVVLPQHGYSRMYCTTMPGCNCEAHAETGGGSADAA